MWWWQVRLSGVSVECRDCFLILFLTKPVKREEPHPPPPPKKIVIIPRQGYIMVSRFYLQVCHTSTTLSLVCGVAFLMCARRSKSLVALLSNFTPMNVRYLFRCPKCPGQARSVVATRFGVVATQGRVVASATGTIYSLRNAAWLAHLRLVAPSWHC